MATLLSTVDPSGPAIYFSKKFRLMLEDHLMIIKEMTTNTIREITSDDWDKLNRFEGDFYGFLTAMNYPKQYHWTILRMNGFSSRFDMNDQISRLILPDWQYIDKLAQLCKEKKKT